MSRTPSSSTRGPDGPVLVGLRGPALAGYTLLAVAMGAVIAALVLRSTERTLAAEAAARVAADQALDERVSHLEERLASPPAPPPSCPGAVAGDVCGSLRITADDEYTVWVNGAQVFRSSTQWMTPQTIAVALKPSAREQNVIAIEARNLQSANGIDRGLVADLTVTTAAGEQHIVTDGTWRATGQGPARWTSGGYDDQLWPCATELGDHGMQPYGPVLGASQARWIWTWAPDRPAAAKSAVEPAVFRKTFSFTGNGEVASADHGCTAAAPIDGAIAVWHLERDGSDSSGNENHGRVRDGWRFGPGRVGAGASNRGNSGGMTLEHLRGLDVGSDFTLTLWARLEGRAYDNDALFDNGTIYLAKRDDWGGRLGFFVRGADGRDLGSVVDSSSLGPVPNEQWIHVAVVRRGDSLELVVNGERSRSFMVREPLAPSSNVFVGVQRHGYPWQGTIDEVVVVGRALSTSALMAAARGK